MYFDMMPTIFAMVELDFKREEYIKRENKRIRDEEFERWSTLIKELVNPKSNKEKELEMKQAFIKKLNELINDTNLKEAKAWGTDNCVCEHPKFTWMVTCGKRLKYSNSLEKEIQELKNKNK